MTNFLCDDPEAAQRNRERVRTGYGNDFYIQQANAVFGWRIGEPAPDGVVLGELLLVTKMGKVQHHPTLDTY